MTFVKKQINKHPLLFLFAAILVTAAVAYFHYIVKGSYFVLQDIGSDTKELYLPVYQSIVNHIKNGDFSLYNLSYGFGTSMYSQNLFHPTMMLLYGLGVIFGASRLAKFLIVIHVVHLLLSGWAAYMYLSSFKQLSLRSRLIAAYIYSFNGYLVIWGQHYTFGLITALLPLVLCCIERSFALHSYTKTVDPYGAAKSTKKSLILLVIISAVCALSTYYFTYMIMLTAAFYTFFRLFIMEEKLITKIKLLVSRGALMVLGVMIGFVYMFPSYMLMAQGTSRTDSDYGILEKFLSLLITYPSKYYSTFFKRLASNVLEGNGSIVTDYTGHTNLYEDPQLYMSALFVILLIQFIIFLPKIAKTLRQRIVIVVGIIFTAFILFIESGSLMYNGFVYPFSRHTFIVLPIFALLIAFTFDFIMDNKKFSILGGIAVIVFYCYECISSLKDLQYSFLKLNALVLLATSTVMIIGFVLYTKIKASTLTRAIPTLIVVILAVQITSDTFGSVYNRATLTPPTTMVEELYGGSSQAVYNELASDNSLFRTERTYPAASTLMDPAAAGYYGVSCYNSIMSQSSIDFLNNLIPEMMFNESEYRPTYRQIIGRTEFERLFGLKYIITKENAVHDGYVPVMTAGDLTLLRDDNMTFAHFYADAISYDDYEKSKTADVDTLISKVLILDTDYATTTSAQLPSINASADLDSVIDMPKPEKEGHLICNIQTNTDGFVFIPITYESGWSAKVDGADTDILKADYGFMAVKVSPGNHVLNLDYSVPYIKISAIISAFSLIIFIVVGIFIFRKKR